MTTCEKHHENNGHQNNLLSLLYLCLLVVNQTLISAFIASYFCFQKLQTIGEDFCGLDVNTPLGGEAPITVVPVLTFSDLLTAVAATSTGDYTVVFLGTVSGHLKKVSQQEANRKMDQS